jgi:hypothetical protein
MSYSGFATGGSLSSPDLGSINSSGGFGPWLDVLRGLGSLDRRDDLGLPRLEVVAGELLGHWMNARPRK